MPRILNVEVTQEDIDLGERESSSHCAVARAINRVVDGEGLEVDVDPTCICVTGYHLADTSDTVETFITSFDDFLPVQPFQFTITLEEDVDEDDFYDQEEYE